MSKVWLITGAGSGIGAGIAKAALGARDQVVATMKDPPKQFYAGSDALAVIRPALEARLSEIKDHEELSKSTDGTF